MSWGSLADTPRTCPLAHSHLPHNHIWVFWLALPTPPLEPPIPASPITPALDIYRSSPPPSNMSEPSETGGRPLDPTTNQLQHPQGSTTPPPTSLHVDHCKSSPTYNHSKKPRKTSPRHRPGGIQQEPSAPHIGSSRSEQLSTASPTDMASHMSPVHYTKTGRISKAKKGLKVHKCDTCGKVS